MSAENILENYITDTELAKQLDVSKRTLDRWRKLRIGPPPTACGRSYIYKIQSARRWLDSCEQQMVRERRKALA